MFILFNDIHGYHHSYYDMMIPNEEKRRIILELRSTKCDKTTLKYDKKMSTNVEELNCQKCKIKSVVKSNFS